MHGPSSVECWLLNARKRKRKDVLDMKCLRANICIYLCIYLSMYILCVFVRFVVTGLDNESEFQLIVYAGNAKGRSGITRLMTHTQKLPVKQLETRVESSSGPEGEFGPG